MASKSISLLLVTILLAGASPMFGEDFLNMRMIPKTLITKPVNVAMSPWLAPLPQDSQPSGRTTQPARLREGGGTSKWVGLAVMAVGGALIARGVSLSDPCKPYANSSVYSCTSNYTSVRATYLGSGGSGVAIGLVLMLRGRH